MYMNLAALPLPPLSAEAVGPRRRHRIAGLELANGALQRFQVVAASLQSESPAPDVDAIASAARSLTRQFHHVRRAPCIRLRMRCLRALRTMASESNWELEPAKRQQIRMIADYSANQDRLVPDAVPVIGGLDSAVLVDLAWPSLQFEVDDYLDFRRLRVEEAAMRGVHPGQMRFGKDDWLQARFAELAWYAHVRRRGQESYLGGAAPALFAMH